jgi:ribosomal protein S18 acetylase RimI-like enzyme
VPRAHVVVRPPTTDDLDVVLAMWEELRLRTGRSGALAPLPSEARLRRVLAEVAEDDTYQAVVAELDGEVVGMACFIGRPLGPFVEAPVVQIDYLHVRPASHRRGVGKALVAAATAYAEGIGSEHVSVNVLPQAREANRFYAKIGFTPLVVRRVASVSTLRRALGLEPAEHSRRAGLLARRRSAVRARATTPV